MPRPFIFSSAATLSCSLLLCAAVASPGASPADAGADDFVVQAWQTDDGLPANAVNDVLQDRSGYIWLATLGGLVRFDGATFKSFSSPVISQPAARNIRALALMEDSTLLMLPALGGVAQFKNGGFSPHPMSEGLAGRQLQSLFVDRSGAVWVGMAGGGVRRWKDGKSTDFGPAAGLSSRAMFSFAMDSEGQVWIAGGFFLGCYKDGGLTRLSETQDPDENTKVASSRSGGIWLCKNEGLQKLAAGKFTTVSTDLPWVASGGSVREMFEDSSGALWIGTSAHGLYRFADGELARVKTSQSQITSINEDSEGDIWVGTTGGGINRLRPKLFHLYDTKSGLEEDLSDAVYADDQGEVWLANRSSGVARISGGKVSVLNVQAGPRKFRAYSVCTDDHGWVWGSEGGLYRFPRDHPDQAQTVKDSLTGGITGAHDLFKSRSGDIWVGAEPDVVGCFRGGLPESYFRETNFTIQHPRSIAEDSARNIWVGTEGGQLYQLAGEKPRAFTEKDGLPYAPIRALCAGADGSLWIGTIGGGLVLRRHEKFTVITVSNGLPDDNIAEMVEDNAGLLWCGSRSGIFHLATSDLLAFADGKTAQVGGITFGKSDGLAGVSCLGSTEPMACKASDGQLWLATQQGVLSVDSTALKINSRPPPVFIDEVLVNNQPLPLTDPLKVPPLCHKIEFRFSVLSYAAPQRVRIRYKLDNVHPDWVEVLNQRSAVYPALGPGKYRMEMKACNNDGVWNEAGTALSFTVQPAWWQSWWFQGAWLIALASASAVVIRYWSQRSLKLKLERLEQQQAMTKERTRIARDLHDDLGATVTQVGLMLEELRETPLSAEGVKHQSAAISGRVRNLARDLDAVVWSVNPGNDSLGELFAYLSQSFLECFQRTSIRPRLEVMEAVPDSALAPEVRHQLFLVVKEAMNNVIKHSQATEVTMSLGIVGNSLEIRIEDNGRGFASDTITRSKRQGIPNMRARVKQLAGQLAVSAKEGMGTTIHISIPSWKDLGAGVQHTE